MQMYDADGIPHIGTLYVTCFNAAPNVDIGNDQTIAEGATASFTATIDDPGNTLPLLDDIVSIQWDFNYDGVSFNPDPSANGQTSASHQYLTAGTYDVAIEVTDKDGDVGFTIATVTVTNVAPLVSASNSGGAEGSPVTFSVSVGDIDPNDTFFISVDWEGNGIFEDVTDPIPGSNKAGVPAGTYTFTHIYDDNGVYNAIIRVEDWADRTDEFGDQLPDALTTDVHDTVAVSNVAPKADFTESGVIAQYLPVQTLKSGRHKGAADCSRCSSIA